MIPALSDTGHLPPGRYRTTLEEVEERFVRSREFEGSTSRTTVWDGLGLYLHAWDQLEQQVNGVGLLKWLWIGGSFASAKLNPSDIDVSVVIDGDLLRKLRGRPGIGKLRDLFNERAKVRETFKVEPAAIQWRAVASTWTSSGWNMADRDYLERRGALDDWWQRVRSDDHVAPHMDDAPPRRGYLEVEL